MPILRDAEIELRHLANTKKPNRHLPRIGPNRKTKSVSTSNSTHVYLGYLEPLEALSIPRPLKNNKKQNYFIFVAHRSLNLSHAKRFQRLLLLLKNSTRVYLGH